MWQGNQGDVGRCNLICMVMLAAVTSSTNAGRCVEAVPFFEATLDGRRKLQDPEHPDTLAAEKALADCLKEQGDTSLQQ